MARPIRITNKTKRPTREINRIVRTTLGYLDITHGIDVVVYHRRDTWAGPSHHVGGHYHPYYRRISAGIPKVGVAPSPWHPYRRVRDKAPVLHFNDWREQLVALIAHEGQHHRQSSRRRGGRGFIEAECDLAAARCLGYWREDEAKRKRAA